MKKYFSYQVKKEIIVQKLITIEALDISGDYRYPEESHEFYEFAYIDAGSIQCCLEGETVRLRQGDFLLIPPFRAHAYQAVKEQPAAVFIICFRSHSDYLSILDHKIPLDKEARQMIFEIIRESKNAFVFPFDKKLKPMDTPLFGAQQLVENGIEKLLILLIRNQIRQSHDIIFVMNSMELEHSLSSDIIQLLKEQLYGSVTLEDISLQTHYSKTFLNNLFKKSTGMPIMKYYSTLKIREAKKLLRENTAVATVASRLNYESPTYFTKVFKKHTGMTPSAYKKSVFQP